MEYYDGTGIKNKDIINDFLLVWRKKCIE